LADSHHQIAWSCSDTARTSHYGTASCFELLSSALPVDTWNSSLYGTDGPVFCLRDYFFKRRFERNNNEIPFAIWYHCWIKIKRNNSIHEKKMYVQSRTRFGRIETIPITFRLFQ
jgi:hypothetical protein